MVIQIKMNFEHASLVIKLASASVYAKALHIVYPLVLSLVHGPLNHNKPVLPLV